MLAHRQTFAAAVFVGIVGISCPVEISALTLNRPPTVLVPDPWPEPLPPVMPVPSRKRETKPLRKRENPALDALKSGVWAERGCLDSIVHAGTLVEPAPAEVVTPEPRLVAVGWDMPQMTPTLTPPTLIPGGGGTPSRAPEVVVARPIEAVRPVEAARPIEAARAEPLGGKTPCMDLRYKALKLRSAASQCDSDLANGVPTCSVYPTFDSPSIPRSLSASDARYYAGLFDGFVNRGDERACAEYGGQGKFPEAAPRPLLARLRDAMDQMANDQVREALLEYAAGGLLSKISYGPDAPWTRALRNHFYLDTVRERIRDRYAANAGNYALRGEAAYSLNRRSISENIRLLLRDLVAPVIGANMAYATGSIGFRWEQVGEIDTWRRQVTVQFTATDALRLGSQTRVPLTDLEIVPDDAFGPYGPMHTVRLEWRWTEVISY